MQHASHASFPRLVSCVLVAILIVACIPGSALAIREGATRITAVDSNGDGTIDRYEVDWDGDGIVDEEWFDFDGDEVIDAVAWRDEGDPSRSPRGRIGMRVRHFDVPDGGLGVAIDWEGDGYFDEFWWDMDGDGEVEDADIYATESKVVDNTKATRFRGVFVGVKNGLNYPEKDVDDLTGALAEYGSSWDSADMNKLKGDAATPAAIQGAIDAAKAASKPGDEFVFFFSGHGGGYHKDRGLSGGRIDTNGDETAIRIPESEFGRFDGSALSTPPAGKIFYYRHDLDGDGVEDTRTVRKSDGSVEVWRRRAAPPPAWIVAGKDSNGDGVVDKDDGGVDMNGDGDKDDTVGVDDTILVAGKAKVTDDDLTQWLSGFPESVTIVVIIDACFSGSFVPDLKNGVRDSAGKPLRPGHLEVITAAPADEPAWEMPISNGVLTQGILNGLARLPAAVTGGHDTSIADYIGNQDDRTTTRELFEWAGGSAVTFTNLDNDGDGVRNEDGPLHVVETPSPLLGDETLDAEFEPVSENIGVVHIEEDDDGDGLIDEDPGPQAGSFFDVYYDPDFGGLPTPTFMTAFAGDAELNATGMSPQIRVWTDGLVAPGTHETPGETYQMSVREVPDPLVPPPPPGYAPASQVFDVSLDTRVYFPPFEEVTTTVAPLLLREPVEDLAPFPHMRVTMAPGFAEGPPAEPWVFSEALGEWQPLPMLEPPDPETGAVTTQPPHFSMFALFRPAPGPWVIPDTTPPLDPWRLQVWATGADVTAAWSNPTDPDFLETFVVRSDTRHAESATDTAGMTEIHRSREPFAFDTGLPDGVYYYTAFSRDWSGNHSGGIEGAVRVGAPYQTPVEGRNRFVTAIQASQAMFPADGSLPPDPEGRRSVVVATGRNWPDALGGSSLAGAVGGPLLLVDTGSLPAAVATEIERLGADRVFLLGGDAAVLPAVEDALGEVPGILDVERIAGTHRYQTAEKIAARTVELLGAGFDGTALVATGRAFPDALAGSPLAAGQGWPIYLSDSGGLRTSTTAAMTSDDVTDAIILGGEAAVPAIAESQLDALLSGTVERLWGSNRYATAVAIAEHAVDVERHRWDGVALATGKDFPDAMAGGVLQGFDGGVVVLTEPARLPGSTRTALEDNAYRIAEVRFLGGEVAIGSAVRTEVMQTVQ